MAPEMNNYTFNDKTDVWSIGICLYMMIKYEFPCDLINVDSYNYTIPNYEQIQKNIDNISSSFEYKHILQKMLMKDN